MKLTSMSFPLMPLIRISQGVFALLVIILSGFVANWYTSTTPLPSPSQVTFLLFSEGLSPNPYITAPFDLTNALFHLAGFSAHAAFLNGLLFCRGDVCHAAQASVAFAAFSFAVWSASAALTVLEAVKVRRAGAGAGAGAAVGGGAGRPAGTGAMPWPGKKEAV
ncbi:predicted protein [Chaetomium globosum CBS 148.51]|uniref:MARVEL domain-containing protein n=1 Tax=Chaetomium globosum (strain ATCC 6205 / CBS 148.51 / DSM 1962 / NBRC 6347 / NRRL 1970) TaxID=306901 RepID=Q2GNW8_CHAGB|nr:uncharacterized protein CHGG_10336 [Chaetomium globosum CBS 148.51]EAQ83932.1 predicted protein [Chaetomium globosum CBS 148.51]